MFWQGAYFITFATNFCYDELHWLKNLLFLLYFREHGMLGPPSHPVLLSYSHYVTTELYVGTCRGNHTWGDQSSDISRNVPDALDVSACIAHEHVESGNA